MEKTCATVLVVDQDTAICDSIRQALADAGVGCTVVAEPGQARRHIRTHRPRVVIADVSSPGVSGLDLLVEALSADPTCRVILVTAVPSTHYLAEALSRGAYDYMEKPLDLPALVETVRSALAGTEGQDRLRARAADALRLEETLRQASLNTVRALVRTVEAKDPYTRSHSDHVAYYAIALAAQTGLPEPARDRLAIAAMLHDVGMIGVPDSVLTRTGPLGGEELQAIRRHPALGAHILEELGVFAEEAHLVRHHHERWDGQGYPDGLAGQEIPLGARILLIADAIDAMLMPRAYRLACPVDRMIDQLASNSGSQFDPALALQAAQWCRTHREELILPDTQTPPSWSDPAGGGR